MANERTLSELRTEARQRANMENKTSFITDAELDRYINQSITELHDLIVEAQGQDFFLTTTTLTTVNGKQTYDLPSDFYLLWGVDWDVDNDDDWSPMRPYSSWDRNRGDSYDSWDYFFSPRYRLEGTRDPTGAYTNQIRFTPAPDGSTDIRIWYIPRSPELTADSDKLQGFNGWEEYVVIDAAMKMLEKEESNTEALVLRKNRIIQRIYSMAQARDYNFPEQVVDVTGDFYDV